MPLIASRKPRRSVGNSGWLWLLASLVLLAAQPAHAEILEVVFSGEITEVNGVMPLPWSEVEVGDPYAMSFVFDSETEDLFPTAPWLGEYELISSSILLGDVIDSSPAGYIIVEPDVFDVLTFQMTEFTGSGGAGAISLFASDAFATDELPLPLDLADYEIAAMEFGVPFAGIVRGDVTSVSTTVVPAPGILALLPWTLLPSRRRRRSSS